MEHEPASSEGFLHAILRGAVTGLPLGIALAGFVAYALLAGEIVLTPTPAPVLYGACVACLVCGLLYGVAEALAVALASRLEAIPQRRFLGVGLLLCGSVAAVGVALVAGTCARVTLEKGPVHFAALQFFSLAAFEFVLLFSVGAGGMLFVVGLLRLLLRGTAGRALAAICLTFVAAYLCTGWFTTGGVRLALIHLARTQSVGFLKMGFELDFDPACLLFTNTAQLNLLPAVLFVPIPLGLACGDLLAWALGMKPRSL